MDFRLDGDDRAVIAASADALGRHLPITRLRSSEPAVAGWRGLAADGWLHASLPADQGGLEIPLYQACAIAREAGRVLAVEGWANNAYLLPGLIAAIADPKTRDAWLARHNDRAGFLLGDGRCAGLPETAGDSAPWCFGVEPGLDVYALAGDRLTRISDGAVDHHPIGDLALGVGSATVTGGDRAIAEVKVDRDALASESAVVHSAALVGLAERAEELTVAYVKVRQQFGQPVGTFQAVKHLLADVHAGNEVAANAVFYAALSGDRASWRISRVQAVRAALDAARAMVQLHGGFGFTWEADVHLFLKTVLAGQARFGSRDAHLLALGEAVLA